MGHRTDDQEPPAELSYEQAVERLEAIIDRIESGQIGLEESIAQYERGMALVQRCRDVLDQAEHRIETLQARQLGQPPSPPGGQPGDPNDDEDDDNGSGGEHGDGRP